ncbi:MAG: MoaD/ThiS family protein [Spartobacteria bacterium]
MKVAVKFYAQLRDLAGASELNVDLPERSTMADLLAEIYRQKPALRAHDKTTLLGVGVEFVNRDYEIQTGDEVAIMPPVQGG